MKKDTNRFNRRRARCVSAALAGTIITGSAAIAGDGNVRVREVVRGDVRFDSSGALTNIHASDGAIIDYHRFDIAGHETVRFHQPGSEARVLNRIHSGSPSAIDGTLRANGIVYLVNPSGVVFGPGSIVDAGGIYAAAGDITNRDFLDGIDSFATSGAAIENHGVIRAEDAAHLIGTRIVNTGSIVVPDGTVALSAGDDVYIGREGERVMVRLEASSPAPGASTVGIDHSGAIDSSASRFTVGDVYSIAMRPGSEVAVRRDDLVVSSEGGAIDLGGQIRNIGEGRTASADRSAAASAVTSEVLNGGGPTITPEPGDADPPLTNGTFDGLVIESDNGNLNIGTIVTAGVISLSTPGHINAFELRATQGIVLRAASMSFGRGAAIDDVVSTPGFLHVLPLRDQDLFIGVPGLSPGDVPGLVITAQTLDAFAPGARIIEFGNRHTNSITIGGPGATVSFDDPVTFRTAGVPDVNFIDIGGTLRASGTNPLTFITANKEIRLNGTIETGGGEVIFGIPTNPETAIGVRLTGDSRIDTAVGHPGGNVTFSGGVDGPFSLSLDTGVASPFFVSDVGMMMPLAGLTIESAGAVDFSNRIVDTSAGTGGVSINAGTIDLSGASVALGAGDALFAHGTLEFDNATVIVGSLAQSAVIVRGRTGAESLGVLDASADLSIDPDFIDRVTASQFVVGGSAQTAPVNVAADAMFSSAFAEEIRFQTTGGIGVLGEILAMGDLAFDGTTLVDTNRIEGRGVLFGGATNVVASQLGVTGSQSVTFGGALLSGDGTEASPVRTALTINSPQTDFMAGAGDATGREFSLVRTDSAGQTTVQGEIRVIGDGTDGTGVCLEDDVTLDGSIIVTDGAANVRGDLFIDGEINANNGPLTVTGDVTVAGDSMLVSTGDRGVVIAGDIDSQAGEANDLTILATNPSTDGTDEPAVIALGGDIGANNALGDLLLNATITGGSAQDPFIDPSRDTLPRVATVLFGEITINPDGSYSIGAITPIGDETAGTATVRADRFITGFNERVTALGALDARASSLAAVGDVTTLGDLRIESPVILLLRRGAGFARTNEAVNGVTDPDSLAQLVAPRGPDAGTTLVSGGAIELNGMVMTREQAGGNATDNVRLASVGATGVPMTVEIDGQTVDVIALESDVTLGDLRLSKDQFAGDLSNDVLLGFFLDPSAGIGGPTDNVDPSGQGPSTIGDEIDVFGRIDGAGITTGEVLNRFDRATLARYGVRTSLVADIGASVYDDLAGEEVSGDRIWAINARDYAQYVTRVFEGDEQGMAAFRTRLAQALAEPGATHENVARLGLDDGDDVLRNGLEAIEGALVRLRGLALSETEFRRARTLLLSIHVTVDGLSEADIVGVLDAWRALGAGQSS